MTERWVDWTADARDRFMRMISDLQEQSLLPDLTSVEDVNACVSEMIERHKQIAADLWDSRASETSPPDGKHALRLLSAVLDEADQVVVDELVSRIPATSIHERMNSSAYLAAELPPLTSESTSPAAETSGSEMVDSELLGDPDDYCGFDPIEDVAVPPQVTWTEAHRKAALDTAVNTYGVSPGEWFAVEWPPTEGSLWSPGSLVTSEWEPCEAHADDPDSDEAEDCIRCEDSVSTDVDEMAVWKFTTTLTQYRIGFDRSGSLVRDRFAEEIDRAFEVREFTQDPRLIRIGPPRRHF
ncbi:MULTISPECIES: hypothetical protein [Gordonia]|uniref:hypothetical protein n=1 Tax=Gordonia TaxID=2053 RepID=UPI003399489F